MLPLEAVYFVRAKKILPFIYLYYLKKYFKSFLLLITVSVEGWHWNKSFGSASVRGWGENDPVQSLGPGSVLSEL